MRVMKTNIEKTNLNLNPNIEHKSETKSHVINKNMKCTNKSVKRKIIVIKHENKNIKIT
jgi:hypothetical protein